MNRSTRIWPGTEEDVIADAEELRIPFSLRGISGLIAVSVTRNTDPDAIGYSLLSGGLPTDAARGFPVCRATIAYPAEGYAAVFDLLRTSYPDWIFDNGYLSA